MVKENLTLEEHGKAMKKACASFNGAWDTVMAQTTVPSGGRWSGAQKQALLAKHFMPTGMLRLITLRISDWASRLVEAAVKLSPQVTLSEILSARPPRWWSQWQREINAPGRSSSPGEAHQEGGGSISYYIVSAT